jgi:hypothetical protein
MPASVCESVAAQGQCLLQTILSLDEQSVFPAVYSGEVHILFGCSRLPDLVRCTFFGVENMQRHKGVGLAGKRVSLFYGSAAIAIDFQSMADGNWAFIVSTVD